MNMYHLSINHLYHFLLIFFVWVLCSCTTKTAEHVQRKGFSAEDSIRFSINEFRNENYLLPFRTEDSSHIALLKIGTTDFSELEKSIRSYHAVNSFTFLPSDGFLAASLLAKSLKKKYDKVIIALSESDFIEKSTSTVSLSLIEQLQSEMRSTLLLFGFKEGKPVELKYSPSLISATFSDSVSQVKTGKLLFGAWTDDTESMISLFDYPKTELPLVSPESLRINPFYLAKIDSLAQLGVEEKAYPGAVILGMKKGKIFYQKAFGTLSYHDSTRIQLNTVFDMASCTKIAATTLAAMKLYDEKRLDMKKTLGDYLSWLKDSDKSQITIKDMLLHQAGFIPDFAFADLLLLDKALPNPEIFQSVRDTLFNQRVAEDLYMNGHYRDSLNKRILTSKLREKKYVYSDIDLQVMAYVVEEITQMPLDEYVKQTFYTPMGLTSTGFNPRKRHELNQIAPTEKERGFRLQHLHGDVHDPRAALFNGVAGHAGLFSTASDMAILMNMLLNGGVLNGKRYIERSTIDEFTSYQSEISRRGIGFDKPEKNRTDETEDPYPSRFASPSTFGHTGYTGTCIWADPEHDFVYVFLSNRVNPSGGSNTRLYEMNIRSQIQDWLYQSMAVKN